MDAFTPIILACFILVMLLCGYLLPPYTVNKVLRIKNKIANRTLTLILYIIMGLFLTNLMINLTLYQAGLSMITVTPTTDCGSIRLSGPGYVLPLGADEIVLCGFAQVFQYIFVFMGLGTLIWRDIRRDQEKKKHPHIAHTHHATHHHSP